MSRKCCSCNCCRNERNCGCGNNCCRCNHGGFGNNHGGFGNNHGGFGNNFCGCGHCEECYLLLVLLGGDNSRNCCRRCY